MVTSSSMGIVGNLWAYSPPDPRKQKHSYPNTFDPQGKVFTGKEAEALIDAQMGREAVVSGMGYPKNNTYWISIIEDPVSTLDPADQKPPLFALKPTAYLAPSVEIAFIMSAKDIAADTDLQRCRVRVGEG